jgi:uncharacterized protein YecT (DUF1311 family)
MRAALIVFCLTIATPASAQSLYVDQNYVRACHASAAVAETAPRCLGQAANQCQRLPGGGTTIGIVECVQGETAVWDALLNAEYGATRAAYRAGGGGLADALLTAQRAWIAFRDAECGLQYTRWQGGTIRSVVHANCMLGFTSTRAIELRDMRGDGS